MITNLVLLAVIIILIFVLIRQSRKVVGISRYVMGQISNKEKNQKRILKLLETQGELSNAQIRTTLNLSKRSTIRYLDELEKEGEVMQIGQTGKDVVYRIKNSN